MPALLRYFSDLIHFKTSKLNPIPLHGNPVLDNFVFKHAAVQTGRTFASAHSCGLRPRTMMIFCNLQIFASAHSCGLRLHRQKIPPVMLALCLSAFVRVATLGLNVNCRVTSFATAHSRGLRRCTTKRTLTQISLPQRIRAGCDSIPVQQTRQRVSLPQRIRAGCDQCANNLQQPDGALPQRIRAGCDIKLTVDDVDCYLCHSAFVRVATHCYKLCKIGQTLCHSAFARVATPDLPLSGASGALCHSAFVRVATKLFILCAEQCFLCHSAFVRVATQP